MNFFVAFAAIVGVLVALMASPSEALFCQMYCPNPQPLVCAHIGNGVHVNFGGHCGAHNDACNKGLPEYNPIYNHPCGVPEMMTTC